MPNYFLAKTDPLTYSLEDLKKDGTTTWDGVHNYQAINVIKSWRIGDLVYIYHSQGEASIVGLAKVISTPRKDNNDKKGISWVADLKYILSYSKKQSVSLKEIKSSGLFNDFALVKQSRLSTMACPTEFVAWFEKKVSSQS